MPDTLQEGFSASDGDRRAGYVARKRIGQHDIGGGQFDGLTGAIHRDLFPKFFTESSGKVDGMSGVRNGPRSNRIGTNALLGQHLGQSCREIVYRTLGCCIGG